MCQWNCSTSDGKRRCDSARREEEGSVFENQRVGINDSDMTGLRKTTKIWRANPPGSKAIEGEERRQPNNDLKIEQGV